MGGPLVSISKRVIKVQPTFVADDNADNDVAFDWITLSNAFSSKGQASTLQSIMVLDGYDLGVALELVFCIGTGNDGTAPTDAQGLINASVTGSAAVDITQAETQAVGICGHYNITYTEGDLINAKMSTNTNVGLVLAPRVNSTALYVGGIWRGEPADMTGEDTGLIDIYLGFED